MESQDINNNLRKCLKFDFFFNLIVIKFEDNFRKIICFMDNRLSRTIFADVLKMISKNHMLQSLTLIKLPNVISSYFYASKISRVTIGNIKKKLDFPNVTDI